jgi:hypothetical protein
MKAFEAVVAKEHENDTRLGMPSTDLGHFARRMTAMENMTGGNGFGKMPKLPRKDAQGLTRGDRKRALREATNAKVSENRDQQFMHSAARRRVVA